MWIGSTHPHIHTLLSARLRCSLGDKMMVFHYVLQRLSFCLVSQRHFVLFLKDQYVLVFSGFYGGVWFSRAARWNGSARVQRSQGEEQSWHVQSWITWAWCWTLIHFCTVPSNRNSEWMLSVLILSAVFAGGSRRVWRERKAGTFTALQNLFSHTNYVSWKMLNMLMV